MSEPEVRITLDDTDWFYWVVIVDGWYTRGGWFALTLEGAKRKGLRKLRRYMKIRNRQREWRVRD